MFYYLIIVLLQFFIIQFHKVQSYPIYYLFLFWFFFLVLFCSIYWMKKNLIEIRINNSFVVFHFNSFFIKKKIFQIKHTDLRYCYKNEFQSNGGKIKILKFYNKEFAKITELTSFGGWGRKIQDEIELTLITFNIEKNK